MYSAMNGTLNYPNIEHTVVNGYRREVVHQRTMNDVPSDFFQNNTNAVVELPKGLDEIACTDLYFTVKNNDESDTSFNSGV